MAEAQLGYRFGTEPDPETGAVVVSVAGSITVSSRGLGVMEVPVTELWFVTRPSVVSGYLS